MVLHPGAFVCTQVVSFHPGRKTADARILPLESLARVLVILMSSQHKDQRRLSGIKIFKNSLLSLDKKL